MKPFVLALILLCSNLCSAAENSPLLMVFSASWCAPCKQMQKDVFPLLKTEMDSWEVIVVDTDKFKTEAKAWKIEGLPTIIFAKREDERYATEIKRVVGYQSASVLKKQLNALK